MLVTRCLTIGIRESFKALSDDYRRQILELLKSGPMTAGEICAHFDLTGATVSHHLSLLKHADLVRIRKDGKYIFYELNATVFEEVIAWIMTLKGDNQDE
jgi:Predicted transcriptional regulators